MEKTRSSLYFKLALLYAGLAVILGLGFGVDIAGWWAVPVYEGLSVAVHNLLDLFR